MTRQQRNMIDRYCVALKRRLISERERKLSQMPAVPATPEEARAAMDEAITVLGGSAPKIMGRNIFGHHVFINDAMIGHAQKKFSTEELGAAGFIFIRHRMLDGEYAGQTIRGWAKAPKHAVAAMPRPIDDEFDGEAD